MSLPFEEEKIPVLSKDVSLLLRKLMTSKDFPLKTSFGNGPKVDLLISIECSVFVGKVRAKISVKLCRLVNEAQTMSTWSPETVQVQGVMRNESGQAIALFWALASALKKSRRNARKMRDPMSVVSSSSSKVKRN